MWSDIVEIFQFSGFYNVTPGHLIMIVVAFFFLYLGIAKKYEPLLLVPIGFGIIVGNIPFVPGMRLGIYETGSIPHKGKTTGLIITEAMKDRLKKYGLKPEGGTFSNRVWECIQGKFIGGIEFAKNFYEDYINPGFKGNIRDRHIEKWMHGIWNGLWGIFNSRHKMWNLKESP